MRYLTANQVIDALEKADVWIPTDRRFVRDEVYVCPTKEWVLDGFTKDFQKVNRWLGSEIYQPKSNDCDKFARRAATLANDIHHADDEGMKQDAAMLFGEFHYFRDIGGNHSINFTIVENGRVLFYEPQTGQEVVLTSTEKELCSAIIF